jgi:hypothetical protein
MKSSEAIPTPGQIIRLRTRTYVVESVESKHGDPHLTAVSAACLDDDAQGEKLDVVWGLEPDTEILTEEAWKTLGEKGFDEPRFFGAYLHTLRWNCVTATDPKLFQSPFRAGIRIDAYQLEPLRKALQLPRVNLFIADDVGLGKTIEAGLIATELLLRRRVREVVVSCPPQMLLQWKDELESRFGLVFEILDRAYLERIRQERGFGVNPWTTFPRFLISHRLLIDEAYTSPHGRGTFFYARKPVGYGRQLTIHGRKPTPYARKWAILSFALRNPTRLQARRPRAIKTCITRLWNMSRAEHHRSRHE